MTVLSSLQKPQQCHEHPRHRPSAISGVVNKLKLAIAALPLISTLSCAKDMDPCYSHNDSTIAIIRQIDGRTPTMRELEKIPAGSFLTEPLLDLINEAHAISSEVIPLNTSATLTDSYCATSKASDPQSERNTDNSSIISKNGTKPAYAQQSSTDARDQGVYVAEDLALEPIRLISLVNHEIGHLQDGNPERGAEVVSQLNEYEQATAGFAMLARQGADAGELARWAYHGVEHSLPKRLAMALRSSEYDAYDKANMFIFKKLGEHQGSFLSVREEAQALVRSGILQQELDRMPAALKAYSEADLYLESRMSLLKEIMRRFGPDTAIANLGAYSHLFGAIPVSGLNMDCAGISAEKDPFRDCVDNRTGADQCRQVRLALCCITADFQGMAFSKWFVQAAGTEYRKKNGVVQVYGFGWDSVFFFEKLCGANEQETRNDHLIR